MFKFCVLINWNIVWVTCFFFAQKSIVHAGINEGALSTVDYIRRDGYPLEIYSNITTEDGYLLDIHRIPHGKSQKKRRSQNPVLLVHGLFRSSQDWVFMGAERGLAYLLADRGYDVWLMNVRGSVYSKKHLTMNPDLDPKFWAFSWHEVGLYDLPTAFELIRNVTKRERFCYIGVSEGTTYLYVLTSLKPEYNRNITIAIDLGPIVHLIPTNNTLVKYGSVTEPLWTPLMRFFGLHEGSKIVRILQFLQNLLCTREGIFRILCDIGIFLATGGLNPAYLNKALIPVILEIGGSGSLLEVQHFAQNVNDADFRQFDFGREINLKKYGSVKPPSYNLTKVTSPHAIFYSDGDLIATTADAETLCARIPNCVYKHKIPSRNFSHFDFVLAENVLSLVYEKVFYLLDKYDDLSNK
ncbi:hypothetical protein ILUMI_21134 [Ignelater luminosus]|uniref:Lipase n=1 Tax=Ignelater luminosus TaxID=2038154 RepID=A0A8K0CIB0_IGNLU|nr:hypothetical protein ILUMI_21134 [Ignelater luminosus]